MSDTWPKPLKTVSGPMRADKVEGAALGMGEWGEALQGLNADGYVPPDMMTALTLFLLGNQPRDPAKKQAIPGAAGGVAGGVWVRERYTIHRPLLQAEKFSVEGHSMGRHVHKGRRYGTTQSATSDEQGLAVASNVTTGLLAYKVEEGLQDMLEGITPDEVDAPIPDWTSAASNPHIDVLKAVSVGDVFGGYEVVMGLGLMEARDTKNPDNPIHSDPELAKKAGLSKPIAGGAHVLAFGLEVLMSKLGRQSLLHGTHFDIRWKTPVYADATMVPQATCIDKSDDRCVFEVRTILADDALAMIAVVTIPLV
jgi:hypothetical protein